MRPRDPDEWEGFLASIEQDPDPVAKPFTEFVIAWAENAEERMSFHEALATAGPAYLPIHALNDTLSQVEAKLGRWTIGFIGQALVVLGTYWAEVDDLDEFVRHMTPIEQRLYRDTADFLTATLQKKAADGAN